MSPTKPSVGAARAQAELLRGCLLSMQFLNNLRKEYKQPLDHNQENNYANMLDDLKVCLLCYIV